MAKKNLEIRKTVGVLIALNALQMAAIVFLAVLSVFDDNVTLDRAESFYLLMIGLVSVIGGSMIGWRKCGNTSVCIGKMC